jgi:hypothetical protein
MAANVSEAVRKSLRHLLEKLSPLGEVDGVRDYLLLDRQGTVLATKPDSLWSDEVARACARDLSQVGEILNLLPVHKGSDCPTPGGNGSGEAGSSPADKELVFDFHFKAGLLIGWRLDGTYLMALCREDTNLAIVRMTVNVLEDELQKDKQLRNYLSRRAEGECRVLSEQNLGSELYKHLVTLKQE